MAIFKPSAILTAISGALGGQVFVQARGANVIRHRPAGKGGRSPRHEIAASAFVAVQRLWRTLSDEQRAAWRSFARDYPSTNRLGIRRPLSAYQSFVRFNIRLGQHRDGLTTPVPRVLHSTDIPASMSVTASASGDILLDFDPDAIPPDYTPLLYGATKSRTSIPAFYNNWRFIATFTTDGTAPGDINAWWATAWPHPVAGQDVALRADFYSGLMVRSASFTATTITTA